MTAKEKYMRTDMNLGQKNGVAATTQDVLTHHLTCFGDGDIAGTMADYTAESRFFTPDGLLRGSEAIRRFFVRLFEEFAKLRQEVDGDAAYITIGERNVVEQIKRRKGLHIVRGQPFFNDAPDMQ
jgi:hypothetical protein